MKKLTEKDYVVSTWSGGKTIQLGIGPEGAVYADRTFDWRLSSATVDLPESDFTSLPDYDRLIAPLNAHMVLSFNGGEKKDLAPFEVCAFDGADVTHSWGQCTDFNLMMRKGRCTGEIKPIELEAGAHTSIVIDGDYEGLVYCVSGSCHVANRMTDLELTAKESAAFTKNVQQWIFTVSCNEKCTLFLAKVKNV